MKSTLINTTINYLSIEFHVPSQLRQKEINHKGQKRCFPKEHHIFNASKDKVLIGGSIQ